ncbi:MAG: DUF4272 domain-containing protein [Pirellulaceae bacterium]
MRFAYAIVGVAFLVGCSGDAADTSHTDDSQQAPGNTEMREYPSPETWEHGSERQHQRAARSLEQLKRRHVPAYSGPLMVDDDEEVRLQNAQEVARRTLVLWAVELRAEGMPQKEALELIDQLDLWDSVSAEEKRFLEDDAPDPDECQALVWRLESIWVLLWALGYIDELDWPGGMCDVPKLVKILKPLESDPQFITGAKLRSKADILDAQDLIMRIHWAVREAYLRGGGIVPDDLDWSHDSDWIPVSMSAAIGVVEQRHYTLNWLVNFLDPEDWDHVDTPT